MQGPLHEIGLIEVLQLLARGRGNGVLRVVGHDPTAPRTLLLSRGRIVSLEPDAGDPAVDAALIAQSFAVPGEIGVVARSQREATRVGLARAALDDMLTWQRGRFNFEEASAVEGPLALEAEQLIRDLVSAEHRRVDLAGELESFHAIPDFPWQETDQARDLPTLDPLDWRILDAVDGIRNVAAIATRVAAPLEEVGERILALRGETILVMRQADNELDVAARAAVQSGRYEDAVERLRARVASVPADHEAWRLLGLAEVGAGRFDHAIEAWSAWRGIAGARSPEADALIHAARTMLEAMREHRE